MPAPLEACLAPGDSLSSQWAAFGDGSDAPAAIAARASHCLRGLTPGARYEVRVSVAAWSPIEVHSEVLWGGGGWGGPASRAPGARGAGSASDAAPLPVVSAGRGDERLVFDVPSSGDGGDAQVRVEFVRTSPYVRPLGGVPYDVRLDAMRGGACLGLLSDAAAARWGCPDAFIPETLLRGLAPAIAIAVSLLAGGIAVAVALMRRGPPPPLRVKTIDTRLQRRRDE